MDAAQLELLRVQQQAKEQLEKEAQSTKFSEGSVAGSTAPTSPYSEETYSGFLFENETGLYKDRGAFVSTTLTVTPVITLLFCVRLYVHLYLWR